MAEPCVLRRDAMATITSSGQETPRPINDTPISSTRRLRLGATLVNPSMTGVVGSGAVEARVTRRYQKTRVKAVVRYAALEAIAAPIVPRRGIRITSRTSVTTTPVPAASELRPG